MADPRLVTAPRAAAVAGGGRTLRLTMWAMIATDVGFLIYWAVVATRPVPARLMFVEYADPRVQAWNWSFLPLDLAASLTGFAAASSVRRGGAQASARLALSLGLTATAGGMAIAYWLMRGQFDLGWLVPNAFLLLFPLPLLRRLVAAN